MLGKACKVFNNGGKGDPIVAQFKTLKPCPQSTPKDAIKTIHEFVPIMWGGLRGNKGLLAALDYLKYDYFHIDHAYFGRGHENGNYRISISSRFAGAPQAILPDRLGKVQKKYFKDEVFLREWRKNGEHILICPPSKNSNIYRNSFDWLDTVITNLSLYTDRPVKVKQKTEDDKSVFENAWAVITEDSNVAVDAYNYGVPVFSMKEDIYTYYGNIGLEQIERPALFDRHLLFNWLAYNQFTLDEIKSGSALSILADLYG